MFGYKCMENSNYPYMTESAAGFWRRWHISLSHWFRDYIYIPLGGSRNKNPGRVYFNLLAVWLLTGIWHGADWTFIAWGLGFFIMISFERLTGLPKKIKSTAGKIIYRIITLAFVLLLGAGLYKGSMAEYEKLTERANEVGSIGLRTLIDKESMEKSFSSGPWENRSLSISTAQLLKL